MDYKLNKVKRGTFFNHDIELKFYSTDNDKAFIKEFVELYVNEEIVFKGDLDILLNGNVKPVVFKKYMIYLINTPDVTIPENIVVEENTNNIDWYEDPATNYKLVSNLTFKAKRDRFGNDIPIRISYFTGNSPRYNKYIISHVVTGEILKIYNNLDLVIDFMRDNIILSIIEFINCANTFKSWQKRKENVILPVIIFDYDIQPLIDSADELDRWLYKIPNNIKDARYIADRIVNNNSILSFTSGNYDGKLHKYRKLNENEEIYEELRAVRTCGYNSSTSFILLNSEENKLYVTIPRNILKDQFGIRFYHDDKGFNLFSDDISHAVPYHKLFDVFYDETDKWAYVCLSLNTIFTDDNIIKVLPDGMLEYINENFGMFLDDIFSKYEEFKELEEEYVTVATSLDKEVIANFLGLNKYSSISSEDDLMLNEYIKIKKVLLNK